MKLNFNEYCFTYSEIYLGIPLEITMFLQKFSLANTTTSNLNNSKYVIKINLILIKQL